MILCQIAQLRNYQFSDNFLTCKDKQKDWGLQGIGKE
ncbi:hypothetical protein SAMN04488541_10951 [Thermoflexibacter ruber]|uniref:Uncharacterized protein n=1 Tax=Thermoflexibacter ruber TaxID=1003 RepID=A0A1I2KE68_9BACT|nr:hypothetical protein SAMN04488541_10951 [Thermoflexibacter ruber]